MKVIQSCTAYPMWSDCADAQELARNAATRYSLQHGGWKAGAKIDVIGNDDTGYTGIYNYGNITVACQYVDDTHYAHEELT